MVLSQLLPTTASAQSRAAVVAVAIPVRVAMASSAAVDAVAIIAVAAMERTEAEAEEDIVDVVVKAVDVHAALEVALQPLPRARRFTCAHRPLVLFKG